MILATSRSLDSIALVLESGRQVTYAELRHDVTQRKAAFTGPGVLFCLCNNDYPSLLTYLAALEAKVVPLLLPGTLQPTVLGNLVATYAPRYLFHPRGDLHFETYGKVILHHDDYRLMCRGEDEGDGMHPALALLLATSGSTGSPKLVRLSSKNILANADSIIDYLGITVAERAITSLPMHYSYGLSVINTHLRAGASLVLTGRSLMDPEFWRLIQRHEATGFSGVPYTYEMLLKLRIERLQMPSITTMTQAGGRLSPDKTRAVADACTQRGIRFFTMYGQTEATARMAYVPCERARDKAGCIGISIPGGRLWLEDGEGNRIDQPGVVGQLVYAGPNVSLGYATSRSDLMSGDSNGGTLHTGDLASFDEEGYFSVCGRLNRFVKIFGVRISLDSVERCLAERGLNCAATGSDDRLQIFLAGNDNADTEAARISVAEMLGLNKAGIAVTAVASLPLLETGKIDYQRLAGTCT